MKPWFRLTVLAGLVTVVLLGRVHSSVFYMMLFTCLVSIYLPRYLVGNLSLTRDVQDDRLFVGESTALRLVLTNRGRLPISWLHARQNLPYSLSDSSVSYSLALPAQGSETITVSLEARERGFHPLGRIHWTVGDLLGFADISGQMHMGDYILVYPRLYRLEGWPLNSRVHLGDTRVRDVWFEDPARVIGVRDYAPGDSMKRINWKVSARVGSLKTKELEPTVTAAYHILLNLDDGDYRYETTANSDPELAVEFAGSLAFQLSCARSQVGLSTNGRDAVSDFEREMGADEPLPSPTAAVSEVGRGNVTAILEVLARVKTSEGSNPFFEMGLNRLEAMPRGTTVVIVTPRPCEDLNQMVGRSRQLGHRTAVFLVGKPKQGQLETIAASGAPFYWVEKVGRGDALQIRSIGGRTA